jgi:hypothetical protein
MFCPYLNLVVKVFILYNTLRTSHQVVEKAILSQFSQKNKVLEENSSDKAAFVDLKATTGEDDNKPKLELDDDDKLDPSIEASD